MAGTCWDIILPVVSTEKTHRLLIQTWIYLLLIARWQIQLTCLTNTGFYVTVFNNYNQEINTKTCKYNYNYPIIIQSECGLYRNRDCPDHHVTWRHVMMRTVLSRPFLKVAYLKNKMTYQYERPFNAWFFFGTIHEDWTCAT